MRLDKFLFKIDESISKKEINDIFKDPNIMVGAELEFILEDLNKILRKNRRIIKRQREAEGLRDIYIIKQEKWEKSGKQGKPPIIPKEIIDYDLLYTDNESGYNKAQDGDYITEPLDTYLDWDIEDDDFHYPDEDDDEEEKLLGNNFKDYMKIWMEVHGFPFGNYKIEFYGNVSPKIGDNFWGVEPDPTLGEIGIELKSPVFQLKEFMEVMPMVFEWIKKHGRTTDKTGFHVNMSIKGISNLKKQLDLHKLALFLDEEYIYKFFASRKNNFYAESLKKKILSGGIGIGITDYDIRKVISNQKVNKFINSSHNDAITFEGLDDTHPTHIEFRYLGGSSYHKKWSNIKPIIARYAHYLNIAVNPSYKKKEYLKKLLRVLRRATDINI